MSVSAANGAPTQPSDDGRGVDVLKELAECRAALAAVQGELQTEREAVANLEIALQTSRRIGAAVGIVMSSMKATEEQAFKLLAMVSQRRNLKLRAIADEVVETGTISD